MNRPDTVLPIAVDYAKLTLAAAAAYGRAAEFVDRAKLRTKWTAAKVRGVAQSG